MNPRPLSKPQKEIKNTNEDKISSNPSMWDAFEHILLFISLYALAISLTTILGIFIDRWVPGQGESQQYWKKAVSEVSTFILRGSLAALWVSYPLFSFFFVHITKRTTQNPKFRSLKSRKFLIYSTLVGTFLIVITNIIRTVYNFLGGNVSLNFGLHIIKTITVCGIIAVYYLYQIREDRKIYA